MTLTPEQVAAVRDPNNPLSNLDHVNTTESKLYGIPKHNATSPPLENATSPPEGIASSASSTAPSANTTTGEEGAPSSESSITLQVVP